MCRIWQYPFDATQDQPARALTARRARQAASEYLKASGVPYGPCEDLELAIGEASKNVAAVAPSASMMVLTVEVEGGSCRWSVWDNGSEIFDLGAVLIREAVTTLTLEEHGRGALMMMALMDTLTVVSDETHTTVEGVLRWDLT